MPSIEKRIENIEEFIASILIEAHPQLKYEVGAYLSAARRDKTPDNTLTANRKSILRKAR